MSAFAFTLSQGGKTVYENPLYRLLSARGELPGCQTGENCFSLDDDLPMQIEVPPSPHFALACDGEGLDPLSILSKESCLACFGEIDTGYEG